MENVRSMLSLIIQEFNLNQNASPTDLTSPATGALMTESTAKVRNLYTVQCSTAQYSTVQYSTVQYSTVQCSTPHYTTPHYTLASLTIHHVPQAPDGTVLSASGSGPGSGVNALVEFPLQGLYHPDLGSRTMEFIESR